VPSISFAQGFASTHDLTQHTTGFSAALHEMRVAEGVLPTGVALNPAGSLLYDGTAPVASVSGVALDIEDKPQAQPSGSQQDTILQTWGQRISQPGVIRHFSFADPAHLGEGPGGFGYGYNYGWYDDGVAGNHPVHDTTVHPGTGGSLRVTLQAADPAIIDGGAWVTNFSNDLQTRYNAGDEFFVQWRQRFDAGMLGPNRDFYGSWKQVVLSSGDVDYTLGGIAGSCRCCEICITSYEFSMASGAYNSRFPFAYHRCPDCGGTQTLEESHPTEFLLHQNMMPAPYCSYNNTSTASTEGTNLPTGNCFIYYPDEWMTFQLGMTLGPRSGDLLTGSRVRIWGQRQGQPSVLLIDVIRDLTVPATDPGYGKFWFTTRNPYPRTVEGKTWYSELIISTQRIPDAL
jgi:hypothetical protein